MATASSTVLKWLSLGLLLVQNALTPITFRWATTEADAASRFDTATAVTIQEVLKFCLSCIFLFLEADFSVNKVYQTINEQIVNQPSENLKLSVPALVYFVQNCLLQVSSANLPAAVFQVLYQGKTIAVAFCSVVMLKKVLSRAKWLAISGMTVGIAFVNIGGGSEQKAAANEHEQSVQLGLMSVVAGCMCSGFAGVYFEKMMKPPINPADGNPIKPPSMWVRNMQLAFFSMIIGAFPILTRSGTGVAGSTRPVLHGFTPSVWLMVVNNVAGGLLTAMVIKYADNILKGFACALATIAATFMSMPLFGFIIGPEFTVGVVLVLISTLVYGGTIKMKTWWNQELVLCPQASIHDKDLESIVSNS